jgi:hypothetical protein
MVRWMRLTRSRSPIWLTSRTCTSRTSNGHQDVPRGCDWKVKVTRKGFRWGGGQGQCAGPWLKPQAYAMAAAVTLLCWLYTLSPCT